MSVPAVAGLVLAAGAGRRFGGPKAEVELDGIRLVDRCVAVLRAGGCDPVLVVARHELSADGARVVINPDPDRGMGSSLSIGLAAVEAAGSGACVLVLVDQVGISPAEIRSLTAVHSRSGEPVVVARREGRRSHPVLLARGVFAEVMLLAEGDSGARRYLDTHAEQVRFVDLDGRIEDIDTVSDLRRLSSRPHSD
ncbi:nucleotidyltransferase family protein [Jatrophihabitans telluris]|uniref:Nucleotidyltransferase family protein n=1 Tax=Jatrophihabitans telluris TaxID=2038343 RepID=A0ABY4R599_9ACTN|nr:nucleotidyltransferase family protein [Jatrophihabitans telluris]UQX90075.1 nucleotidyltransferase family protein [Jatrophihabitans telluris]